MKWRPWQLRGPQCEPSLNRTPGKGVLAVGSPQRPEVEADDRSTATTWTRGNKEIPHSSFSAPHVQSGTVSTATAIHVKFDILLSSG